MEETAVALLALLSDEDGMSIHKACKKLGQSMSEMLRLLSVLRPEALGGLDLVERRDNAGRVCLFLTERGRAVCAGFAPKL